MQQPVIKRLCLCLGLLAYYSGNYRWVKLHEVIRSISPPPLDEVLVHMSGERHYESAWSVLPKNMTQWRQSKTLIIRPLYHPKPKILLDTHYCPVWKFQIKNKFKTALSKMSWWYMSSENILILLVMLQILPKCLAVPWMAVSNLLGK